MEFDSINSNFSETLRMLNNCGVNSQLQSKNNLINGNNNCGSSGTCIANFFSEVPDAQNPNWTMRNTVMTGCQESYITNSNNYYIRSVCCSYIFVS